MIREPPELGLKFLFVTLSEIVVFGIWFDIQITWVQSTPGTFIVSSFKPYIIAVILIQLALSIYLIRRPKQ
jgi:hypothetical protein